MKGEIVRLTSNGKSKSSYGGHFRFIEKTQSWLKIGFLCYAAQFSGIGRCKKKAWDFGAGVIYQDWTQ